MKTLHSTNTHKLMFIPGFAALKCKELPTHILSTQYSWLFKCDTVWEPFIFMINQCYSSTVALWLSRSPVRSFHSPRLFARASTACPLSVMFALNRPLQHSSCTHQLPTCQPPRTPDSISSRNHTHLCLHESIFTATAHICATVLKKLWAFGTLNSFTKA